jgi:hypothetical protein
VGGCLPHAKGSRLRIKRLPLITGLTLVMLIGTVWVSSATNTASAAAKRTIHVLEDTHYMADLCLKNLTKGKKVCTGQIEQNSHADLSIEYDDGDDLEFTVTGFPLRHANRRILPDEDTCVAGGIQNRPTADCSQGWPTTSLDHLHN